MVEEAMLNADEGKMTKWKAEAEKCAAEETRASKLKAKAESAECKAQAAEREAQAARVVMLEAVSGLEKVAAREVMRATCIAASTARSQAHHANDKAAEAAGKAAQPWV
jgi:hypothetical protein